ncbi:calcium-binding mitochondrial carrier protein SCaMC-2 [Galendromus occidentalis]|uniref:Calcium-binding mitochondrial carrier protein SCaMC-2 n=1 Tax=Galendromus occidentalis TaxID=34638 RepID=A0AAJ6VXT0_9ACAR|nr:calcium-binding mitochondrial carrier protein SCaMC-2 [Galendromus occidentalis]
MKSADSRQHELTLETERRLEDLFEKLDVNGDGRIDVSDLTEGLQKLGVPHSSNMAMKFIESSDLTRDGVVDFAEFAQYVREHERNLKLVFNRIDENADGHIDEQEIISSFWKMGIKIDQTEAHRLLRRMDTDGSLTINYEEWRDYLLFHPASNLHDIISLWRHHSTILDVGEDSLVPDDFTEAEFREGIWWRHLVSGGIAGTVSRTCTAPLDRIKVFLQVHGKECGTVKNCYKQMIAEGGRKSLWRGNGVNVMKIGPESAIKFLAYEKAKQIIRGDEQRDVTPMERFCAGSIAGSTAQTIIYPMEVLKTRLALRKTGQYNGIFDAARKIFRQEGLSSFYRGYVPNLLGIIPYAGIDLAVYETLKKLYISERGLSEDPSAWVMVACGTTSSTCGQIASYPLALVRTRLQAADPSLPRHSFGKMLYEIVVNEGPRGLYRGIAPNFMKVAPAVSISYVVYEHVRKALGVEMT